MQFCECHVLSFRWKGLFSNRAAMAPTEHVKCFFCVFFAFLQALQSNLPGICDSLKYFWFVNNLSHWRTLNRSLLGNVFRTLSRLVSSNNCFSKTIANVFPSWHWAKRIANSQSIWFHRGLHTCNGKDWCLAAHECLNDYGSSKGILSTATVVCRRLQYMSPPLAVSCGV